MAKKQAMNPMGGPKAKALHVQDPMDKRGSKEHMRNIHSKNMASESRPDSGDFESNQDGGF